MNDFRAIMDEIVVDRTQSLFESAGIALVPCEPMDYAVELVGVIGFAAEAVRGALGLAVSPAVAELGTRAWTEGKVPVDDWLGEAANQLLGRIKNRLVDLGIPVTVALPMVLRGVEVRLCPRSNFVVSSYHFRHGTERVLVWLDLQITGEIVVAPRSDPDEQAMNEGGMVLF